VKPRKPGVFDSSEGRSRDQSAGRPKGTETEPPHSTQPAGDTVPGRAGQRQPIEGNPGEHPAGTASGAVIGGAAGAAMGAIAGPMGTILGAGIGAVAGGLAGRGIAEAINPREEEGHWRQSFAGTEYSKRGRTFESCEPAYRYGWEACIRHGGRSFDEVESELGREWDSHRGRSDLGWMEARPAARDAWTRVQSRVHARSSSEGRMIT
jgi:hypothetical protein